MTAQETPGRRPFLAELESKWGRARHTVKVEGCGTPGAIWYRETWLWFPGGLNHLISLTGRHGTVPAKDTWQISLEANVAAVTSLTVNWTGADPPEELFRQALDLAGWSNMTRAEEIRAVAEDILSRFSAAKGDGQRARVGQVQMIKWRAMMLDD